MVKIGNKKIFQTEHVIWPKDEKLDIDVEVEDVTLKLTLSLEIDKDDKSLRIVRNKFEGLNVDISLINWINQASLRAISTPYSWNIAGINNKKITLAAIGRVSNDFLDFHIQFMIQGECDD